MVDRTFKEARADNEIVLGTPAANQEQITGQEVLGNTSATDVDSGVRTVTLRDYAVNQTKADSDWMAKSVYDGNDNGLVNGAEKIDDGTNSSTASEVRTHLDDVSIHFVIDDAAPSVSRVWSSSKVNTELGLKVDTATFNAHTGDADIHRALNDGATTATNLWSGLKISNDLADKASQTDLTNHTGDSSIHTVLNDLTITTSNLWSASKINTELGAKVDTSTFTAHTSDADIHRVLDDAQTTTTNLWSGSKINTELAAKAPASHVGDSTHLSTDERNAITNMPNPPTAANPFASQADISAGSLTDAEFPTYAVFSSKIVGAAAIDFASGNKQEVNASTHSAVTVTSPAGHPANFMLVILNSGSLASIAPAAGGSILWENGTPPSWAGTSVLALYYDGSVWYGSAMVNVS